MLSPTELLADLARLPSVNPMGRGDLPADQLHEGRVTDYLERQLRPLGVPVTRTPVAAGRDNLTATLAGTGPHLLFAAHQDTVPADGMTVPPFGAEVRDGRLYGRGACDVKAGAAAMLHAFTRLAAERPAGMATVTLAFTVDEEYELLGARRLARDLTADFAVVAEPTGLDVVTAHKGVVHWTLTTAGRACHASRPDEGTNAVFAMGRVLAAVEWHARSLGGGSTLTVCQIAGGVAPNVVPDRCTITLDRRLVPGETAEFALRMLLAAVDEPVTVEPAHACPPLSPVADDHPLLRRLEACIGRCERRAVAYGTDASTLAAAGIPCVVFGPGDIAQAHTADEWVELAQVDRAADILFRFAAGRP